MSVEKQTHPRKITRLEIVCLYTREPINNTKLANKNASHALRENVRKSVEENKTLSGIVIHIHVRDAFDCARKKREKRSKESSV